MHIHLQEYIYIPIHFPQFLSSTLQFRNIINLFYLHILIMDKLQGIDLDAAAFDIEMSPWERLDAEEDLLSWGGPLELRRPTPLKKVTLSPISRESSVGSLSSRELIKQTINTTIFTYSHI